MVPSSLRPAYAAAARLARRHYENFPVASLLLPKELRPPVAALYAFARRADDFADEGTLTPRERRRRLDLWGTALRRTLAGKPFPPGLSPDEEGTLGAFAHALKSRNLPPKSAFDLLSAFRQDVTVKRYATWSSLLAYCRRSAAPVGRLVLAFAGVRDQRLLAHSDFLCAGLQLANFWQDTAKDVGERNRIYYPKEEWRRAGVTEREIRELRPTPPLRALVKRAVDYTELLFAAGHPLLSAAPPSLRLELRLTYAGGRRILEKIRSSGYDVFTRRPVVGRVENAALLARCLVAEPKP